MNEVVANSVTLCWRVWEYGAGVELAHLRTEVHRCGAEDQMLPPVLLPLEDSGRR